MGERVVPRALRARGWNVRTLGEMFGKKQAQFLEDVQWMVSGSQSGYAFITQDIAILYEQQSPERATLSAARCRGFFFPEGDLPAQEQIQRLVKFEKRIFEAACQPGPCAFVLYKQSFVQKL